MKTSIRTEMWYRNALLGLVKELRSAVENNDVFTNELKFNDTALQDDMKAFDLDRFLTVVEKLQKADISGFAQNTANGVLNRGNQQNVNEVGENLKRQVGLDLKEYLHNSGKVSERLKQLTEANVQLIESIHSQYLDKVKTAVTQAQIKGTLTKDLVAEIKKIGGVTENRAKLIARDQSAKINSSLTQARYEEMGITHYRWSTSGDERVRDSHAENDGKIFAYDDPPETGHPGFDFNCRCVAVLVFDVKTLPRNNTQTESDRHLTLKGVYLNTPNLDGDLSVTNIELLRVKAEKIEPQITKDIVNIISSVGGKVEGLEYRLKSLESLERKIKTEMLAGLSEHQALTNVKDVVRYTAVFDTNTFVEQYQKMQDKLFAQGYSTITVKNTWENGATYKGVNTFVSTFIEKDNVIFEMQYHTQESFNLKNGKLHQLYEKFRDPDTSVQEKEKIFLEMQKLSANLKIPKNIALIKGKK